MQRITTPSEGAAMGWHTHKDAPPHNHPHEPGHSLEPNHPVVEAEVVDEAPELAGVTMVTNARTLTMPRHPDDPKAGDGVLFEARVVRDTLPGSWTVHLPYDPVYAEAEQSPVKRRYDSEDEAIAAAVAVLRAKAYGVALRNQGDVVVVDAFQAHAGQPAL